MLMQVSLDGSESVLIREFDQRVRLISSSKDGKWLSIRNVIIVKEKWKRTVRTDYVGAIRLEDGEVLWTRVDRYDRHSTFWSPDGTCYMIQDQDRLIALELSSGEFTDIEWLAWIMEYQSGLLVYSTD